MQFVFISIFGVLAKLTSGFVDDTGEIFEPGFPAIIDMQDHINQAEVRKGPDLTQWKKWSTVVHPSSTNLKVSQTMQDPLNDVEKITKREKLLDQVNRHKLQDYKPQQNTLNYLDSNKKQGYRIKTDSQPTFKYWSKRAENSPTVKKEVPKNASMSSYAEDDEMLNNLKPDLECPNKLPLCSKNPMRNLECVANCYLSQSLAKPNTKFLYRLLYIFKSFNQYLCPTFGTIYDTINDKLNDGLKENSLSGFLKSLGIGSKLDPIHVQLVKNAPLALFNNMVKFVSGKEFDLVKPLLGTAESAAKAQLSKSKMFTSTYYNPLCKKAPGRTWVISLIDAMMIHPGLSDIFLRGYWVLSRALQLDLRYPLDNMLTSWVMGIKMLAGVECSFIPYAEHGKPFKCMNESPLQKILDDYSKEAEKKKNPYSWLVCGAHQVDIPDWIKDKLQIFKKTLVGRTGQDVEDDDEDENNTTQPPQARGTDTSAKEMDKLSNPEEFDHY